MHIYSCRVKVEAIKIDKSSSWLRLVTTPSDNFIEFANHNLLCNVNCFVGNRLDDPAA